MNSRLTWIVLISIAFPAVADTGWTSREGHFRVSYQSEIEPIVINRMHRWLLEITDRDGNAVREAKISVDGGMPLHDHGLPTRPRVTGETLPGRYRLEGLRFHMGGKWVLELTIEVDGVKDVVDVRLEL